MAPRQATARRIRRPRLAMTLRLAGALCLATAILAPAVLAPAILTPAMAQSFSIAATVNDDPISAWDVDQRIKFYQATGAPGVKADELRKKSLDELVEELLMTQEMKRVGVSIGDDEVRQAIEARLVPLKRTFDQFRQYLSSRGVDIATLENQLRARLGWASVIRRTYGNLVSITESDIAEATQDIADKSEEPVEEIFDLQRIVFEVPVGSNDLVYAQRMEEAERFRKLFIECSRTEKTLRRIRAVKIESIPKTKADALEEPTRSLVLASKSGQITPPNPTPAGVELIAVCERRADGGRRQVAERQLLSQELSLLASRHLRDLRQDAVVDLR